MDRIFYELRGLYHIGGSMVSVLLVFALAANVMSVVMPIVAYASGRRRLAVVFTLSLAVAGAVLVLAGSLAQSLALSAVQHASASAHRDDRDLILAVGTAEAHVPLVFALAAAIIPWMAAAITLPAARRRSAVAVWGGVLLALGIGVLVSAEAGRQLALFQVRGGYLDPHASRRMGIVLSFGAAATERRTRGLVVGAPLAAIGLALLLAGRPKAPPGT